MTEVKNIYHTNCCWECKVTNTHTLLRKTNWFRLFGKALQHMVCYAAIINYQKLNGFTKHTFIILYFFKLKVWLRTPWTGKLHSFLGGLQVIYFLAFSSFYRSLHSLAYGPPSSILKTKNTISLALLSLLHLVIWLYCFSLSPLRSVVLL